MQQFVITRRTAQRENPIIFMKNYKDSMDMLDVMMVRFNRTKIDTSSLRKEKIMMENQAPEFNLIRQHKGSKFLWTKEEEDYILENRDKGMDFLCRMLPHRKKNSIQQRFYVLTTGKNKFKATPKIKTVRESMSMVENVRYAIYKDGEIEFEHENSDTALGYLTCLRKYFPEFECTMYETTRKQIN